MGILDKRDPRSWDARVNPRIIKAREQAEADKAERLAAAAGLPPIDEQNASGATAPEAPPVQTPESTETLPAPSNSQNSSSPSPNTITSAWDGTEPIDSYEEYLRKKEGAFATIRDGEYEKAKRDRIEADRRTEVERERKVVDARSSYEQNLASYGAKSEAMASMGLTGSGYSDYLNSKAYSQQRAETQAANAQADSAKRAAQYAEEQARDKADSNYYQNIIANDDAIGKYRLEQVQKSEEKAKYATATYAELLSGANTGAYSADQLRQLASEYGLTEDQIQILEKAANDYTKKSQALASSEVYWNSGNFSSAIDSAAQAGTISTEQAEEQKSEIQKQNYELYVGDISNGNADTGAIDRAYNRGEISESQYNSLKTQWNDNIDTSSDFFYANNTMLTKSAAQKALNNLTKNEWCSQANKNTLQEEFDKLYTPKVNGKNYNASDKELADEGNNFKVELNGEKYCVESAGECTDKNVEEVASDVGNGAMFGYQGHVYIKSNGKIYEIRKRKNTYQKDWNAVYEALCG